MKTVIKLMRAGLIFIVLLLTLSCSAPEPVQDAWDDEIVQLIRDAYAHDKTNTLVGRIDYLTQQFVMRANPYVFEPLGEGSGANFNQKPLYRLDVFDCMSFVETMLALASTPLASDSAELLNSFQEKINAIRYKDSIVSFYTRNHFPEVDWMPNNSAAHHFIDITREVALNKNDLETMPVFINKKVWYDYLTIDRIYLIDENAEKIKQKKLDHLKATGSRLALNEGVGLSFIPPWEFFGADVNTSAQLHALPHGSIVQFIRPGYDLKEWVGTFIAHQGIIIHHDNQVYIRHASTLQQKVIEELLTDYMEYYQVLSDLCDHSWQHYPQKCMRGINVLMPQ